MGAAIALRLPRRRRTLSLKPVGVEPFSDELGRVLALIEQRLEASEQEAYSLDEVAKKLSVSKRQVQQWVRSGVLPTVLLPETDRLRRVTKAQLQAFVQTAELQAGFKRPRWFGV